jgi:hypothetical protein
VPVRFLTADQKRYYGRYAEDPTSQQLSRYFHLDDADRQFIHSCTNRPHTSLGIAVQVGTVRYLGRFLTDWRTVPQSVVRYVALQLGVDSEIWVRYLKRFQTTHEHRWLVCDHYGYREFSDPVEQFGLVRLTTIIYISRLNSAACTLVSLSFVLPLPGLHVRFPTAPLARL